MELTETQRKEVMAYVMRRLGPNAQDAAIIAISQVVCASPGIVDGDGDLTTCVRDLVDKAVPMAREVGLLPAEEPEPQEAPKPTPLPLAVNLTIEDVATAIKDALAPAETAAAKFAAWLATKYKMSEADFAAFRPEAQRSIEREYADEVDRDRRTHAERNRVKIPAMPGNIVTADPKTQLRWINLQELKARGLATDQDIEAAGFDLVAKPKEGGSVGGKSAFK